MESDPIRILALGLLLFLPVLMWAAPLQSQNSQLEIEGWDISALDARISDAVAKANAIAAGPATEEKLAAAAAYLQRANVFYESQRPNLYRLALGDFRRVLRYQPDNAEAREKVEQISSIYQSLGRTVPDNGSGTDIYNDPGIRYKYKPQQIDFPENSSLSTVSESLPPGVSYLYEVNVLGGQQIAVGLDVGEGAASFEVYGGLIMGSSPPTPGKTQWSVVAPEAGKYLIRVSPTIKGARYRLSVTVQ